MLCQEAISRSRGSVVMIVPLCSLMLNNLFKRMPWTIEYLHRKKERDSLVLKCSIGGKDIESCCQLRKWSCAYIHTNVCCHDSWQSWKMYTYKHLKFTAAKIKALLFIKLNTPQIYINVNWIWNALFILTSKPGSQQVNNCVEKKHQKCHLWNEEHQQLSGDTMANLFCHCWHALMVREWTLWRKTDNYL